MPQNILSPDIMLTVIRVIIGLYVLGAAIFIIRENRSTQSTFAWLFLFFALPVLGVIIYLFFGRNWKAFAKENDLARQNIGSDLLRDVAPLLTSESKYIEQIAREKSASYKKKLLNLVRRNSSSLLTGYNQVEILQDAMMKYPRLLEDIRQAKHHIHFNYYIWTEDEFTLKVKDALIERAKAGVEVRCLYDASGGAMSKQYLQELRAAGVEIFPYLEYRSLTRIHTVNYRSHRKIAVFDGKIAYIGGLNLDKDQLDGGKFFDAWRDTHLRIVGEAALALQASFAISWYNTTHQKVSDPAYYPSNREEVKTFTPVQITQSGPDSQWKAIRQLYFFMIMSAEEKVYLQSPFFIPDESILEALKAVALAGVDVKLMFTPRGTTYKIPYWAANTYFKEVALAGAKIYLYQAGYFHPKTLNIDGKICSIGTANMDVRSFSLNYEANAVIYDEGIATELENDFLKDLEHCTEWTVEEYRSRGRLVRFRDSLCRLASPLL
ncbi:MAG: cardiolipin synthase [Anaerolineaceae bacterium 4572_5.2]|nr:MAG: cardiolipin synthase [Anaerolineaceae bacterium 4572_5.2]